MNNSLFDNICMCGNPHTISASEAKLFFVHATSGWPGGYQSVLTKVIWSDPVIAGLKCRKPAWLGRLSIRLTTKGVLVGASGFEPMTPTM